MQSPHAWPSCQQSPTQLSALLVPVPFFNFLLLFSRPDSFSEGPRKGLQFGQQSKSVTSARRFHFRVWRCQSLGWVRANRTKPLHRDRATEKGQFSFHVAHLDMRRVNANSPSPTRVPSEDPTLTLFQGFLFLCLQHPEQSCTK